MSWHDWANLFLRWAHVLAAILWIGDSFLFMWLDSKLTAPATPREGDVVGELWMAHSGGFYELVKRKSLSVLPAELHFFKWESYSTWITGSLLLAVVYWFGDRAMLVDSGSTLSQPAAVAISVGLLAVGTGVYHALCHTPLIRSAPAFGVVGLVSMMGVAAALQGVFAPRAVFLQVGAMLGTIMTSNVFFVIVDAQRHMVAATAAGTPVDTSYGTRAKQRSTHNHYLTFPVLIAMVSNHFPGLYATALAPLVLGLVLVLAVGVKYALNLRLQTPPWVGVGTLAAMVTLAVLTQPAGSGGVSLAGVPPVSFATAQAIVQTRCVTCHAVHPTNPSFAAPPQGVVLDSATELHARAPQVLQWAVRTRAMPLGNATGMTDEERRLLGGWIVQGADVAAAGEVQIAVAQAPAPAVVDAAASPGDQAKQVFAGRCAVCHGATGAGDGAAGVNMNPKPRNYHDAAWQASVSDEHIARVIREGGAAVGKSPSMPPNPDLSAEVVAELVHTIRGFKP
jgi:uncharacterized membrane protein